MKIKLSCHFYFSVFEKYFWKQESHNCNRKSMVPEILYEDKTVFFSNSPFCIHLWQTEENGNKKRKAKKILDSKNGFSLTY